MTALETRLWRWMKKRILWICFAVVLVAGAWIRYWYLPLTHSDISYYYSLWMDYFARKGLAAAFDPDTGYNYSAVFAYLFVILAKIFGTGNIALVIKLAGLLPELATDGLCLCLIASVLPPKNRATGMLTGFVALWLNPILIWNVAAWGQTDVFYLLPSVLSVLLLLRERPGWALICLGVALSLKLQAVFLAPLFAAAWFCGRKRFSCLWFLALPAVVLVSGLPMMLVGESPLATFTFFFGQSGQYQALTALTMNRYNLYSLLNDMVYHIDNATVDMFLRTGIVLCVAPLGGMLVWMVKRNVVLTARNTLLLAAWCVLCCCFLLPRMHERYALVGEVLLCCWAVCLRKPRGAVYVLAALLPTVGAYANELYRVTFLGAQAGGALSLALLCALTWEILRDMGASVPASGRRTACLAERGE